MKKTKKNIIAAFGLSGVYLVSYFLVLPIAQNQEDLHYGNGPLVFLYLVFAIAIAFIAFKHYREKNEMMFRILILAVMISLIGWAAKYLFLECSVCSMGG